MGPTVGSASGHRRRFRNNRARSRRAPRELEWCGSMCRASSPSKLLLASLAAVLLTVGCESEVASPDARDEVGVVPRGSRDGDDFNRCELDRVVGYLNAGVTEAELLAAGVHAQASSELVAHRNGPDGRFATADDDLFDSIAEVDAVPYVGMTAMQQLVAQIESFCQPPPTACDEAAVLGRAGEAATDYYDVPFAWSEDGWSVGESVSVRVPDDLTGLVIAVIAGEVETGLNRVVLDETTLLDLERDDPDLEGISSPFFHVPVPVGALSFPMDEHSSLSAGCLTVSPVALEDIATARLAFVSRRSPRGGVIDINAVVVGGAGIDGAQLAEVFSVAQGVYQSGGDLGIGDIETLALDWPSAFVETEGAGIHALRAAIESDDPMRMNVYFVQDFLEVGTLGFAAGIPGPNGVLGTAGSGLVISIDSHLDDEGALDLTAMGETVAHEIGHQLGLFHTTESDGLGHDVLDDTPECGAELDSDEDGELTADECLASGADNVMFWTGGDLRQNVLSPTQLEILRASPVVR